MRSVSGKELFLLCIAICSTCFCDPSTENHDLNGNLNALQRQRPENALQNPFQNPDEDLLRIGEYKAPEEKAKNLQQSTRLNALMSAMASAGSKVSVVPIRCYRGDVIPVRYRNAYLLLRWVLGHDNKKTLLARFFMASPPKTARELNEKVTELNSSHTHLTTSLNYLNLLKRQLPNRPGVMASGGFSISPSINGSIPRLTGMYSIEDQNIDADPLSWYCDSAVAVPPRI